MYVQTALSLFLAFVGTHSFLSLFCICCSQASKMLAFSQIRCIPRVKRTPQMVNGFLVSTKRPPTHGFCKRSLQRDRLLAKAWIALQVREPLRPGIFEHMIQDALYRVTPVGRTYVEEYVPLSLRRGCKHRMRQLSRLRTRYLRIQPNRGCSNLKLRIKNLERLRIGRLDRFALLVHRLTIRTLNIRRHVSRACGLPDHEIKKPKIN